MPIHSNLNVRKTLTQTEIDVKFMQKTIKKFINNNYVHIYKYKDFHKVFLHTYHILAQLVKWQN